MIECIHLVDDDRPGGVLTNLNTLTSNTLLSASQHATKLVDPRKVHLARVLGVQNIIVHFSISWAKLPYLIALRVLNPDASLLLQEHHYSPEHFSESPSALRRFRKLYQITARLFNHVIAVSQPQADWYRAMSDTVVSVIPPMSDLEPLLELPARKRTHRLVVGVSGRLNKSKGIDLALSLLESSQAQAFDFLFAGWGELAPAVALAEKAYRNVRFLGAYEHPREFLSRCDLVMIPSRLDTYGLCALEARAAGKPIIVTKTCGLPEQASGCGIVAAENSATALAQALDSLCANNQLVALGQHARSGAIQHNNNAGRLWASALSKA